MGYKVVCLTCRKSFSTRRDYHVADKCSECGNVCVFYNHKFKPPRKDNLKAWEVVGFLYKHGFTYQHIYKDLSLYHRDVPENYVTYPSNLKEAMEFVTQYKGQARPISTI